MAALKGKAATPSSCQQTNNSHPREQLLNALLATGVGKEKKEKDTSFDG
jgi:hypothetical protein